MGKLVLVLGGARSGKSTFAEARAKETGGDAVLYVATSEPIDEEMQERIKKHRASRPQAWRTVEAAQNVADAIRRESAGERVILVDCITVLAANLLVKATGPYDDPFDDPVEDPNDEAFAAAIMGEVDGLIACARDLPGEMIIVSNEVGMGLVPPYELSRAYRDHLGRANQQFARQADEVYFLVAGIPMRIK